MFILIITLIFLALSVFTAVCFNRRYKDEEPETVIEDSSCCGAHEVCEKDTLLNSDNTIIYYDDEELDLLAGVDAESYTDKDIQSFADIFYTLNESDVAGWLRSLQMRRIELPEGIREQALLIVRERRGL